LGFSPAPRNGIWTPAEMMNRSFENLDNLLEHLGSVYNYNQFYFVLIFICLPFFEDDTFDSVDSKYMCTKWAHSPAITMGSKNPVNDLDPGSIWPKKHVAKKAGQFIGYPKKYPLVI
jgi:hypothetical protein